MPGPQLPPAVRWSFVGQPSVYGQDELVAAFWFCVDPGVRAQQDGNPRRSGNLLLADECRSLVRLRAQRPALGEVYPQRVLFRRRPNLLEHLATNYSTLHVCRGAPSEDAAHPAVEFGHPAGSGPKLHRGTCLCRFGIHAPAPFDRSKPDLSSDEWRSSRAAGNLLAAKNRGLRVLLQSV